MVKSQLISNSYEKLTSHSFKESVWAVVQLEGRDKLLIGCIYRSPSADEHNNTQMLNMLGTVADENFSHILIICDFNCKNVNWQGNFTPSDPNIFKFFSSNIGKSINTLIQRQDLGKGKIQVY